MVAFEFPVANRQTVTQANTLASLHEITIDEPSEYGEICNRIGKTRSV